MYRIVSWYKWRDRVVLAVAVLFSLAVIGETATAGWKRADVPAVAAGTQTVCLPILMYHGVLDDASRQGAYVISPSLLEGDLRYLQQNGYETVVMQDLIDYVDQGTPLPEKPIMLTFDDGYYNNYLYAFPLLKQYGMRAVISPVAAWSDFYSKQDQDHAIYSHITWDEMRELVDSGVIEIQNHSCDMHYNAAGRRKGTLRLRSETVEAYSQVLQADLQKAQQMLKQNVGVTPNTFTYPFGAMCSEAEPILRALGFRATLSCESRINRITREEQCLWALGRYLRPAGVSTASYFAGIEKKLAAAQAAGK